MAVALLASTLLVAIGAPPSVEALPAAVPEARKDALARFAVGVWHARRERLLSAANSFEAAAERDPDAIEPLKDLIAVYRNLGREHDAIRVARTVLEKDPRDSATAHALARLLFDAGDLTEAIAVAKCAIENVDADAHAEKAFRAYRDLTALFDKAGDATAAVDAANRTVDLLQSKRKSLLAEGAFDLKELDVETADAFERLGKMLVKRGKPDLAVAAFRSADKLYRDPAKANDPQAAARLDWNLAGAYAAQGDPATALERLEAFLKLQPQAAEPYERFAALLHRVGRGGEAATLLQKYAAREPKNFAVLAVLAAELARDPTTRVQADSYFTQVAAATADPKLVRIAVRSHIESGKAIHIIADLDQAYGALKDDGGKPDAKQKFAAERARAIADVLRNEPEWSAAVLRAAADDLRSGTKRTYQTWHALGVLAARHRKLDLAAEQFRQALRGAQSDAQWDAYIQLINVLRRSRKPAEVAAACRDGLRTADVRMVGLIPAFFNSRLALALAELGEADEALAAVEKAVGQAGDTDRLVYRLIKMDVYKLLGRWEDAVALGRKLLDEFDAPGDRLRIRYELAGAYTGAKKPVAAEAELRTILETDPDQAAACNDLGYHLADQGRNFEEAERLIRRAIALDRADRRRAGEPEPESAAYLDSLAWLLFRKGKDADARDLLLRVAEQPDGAADPVVWDHLGDVRFRLGEKEKAKASWEAAEKLYRLNARSPRDGRLDEVKRKLKRVP